MIIVKSYVLRDVYESIKGHKYHLIGSAPPHIVKLYNKQMR